MAYNPTGERNFMLAARRIMELAWFGRTSSAAQAPLSKSGEYITSLNTAQTGVANLIGLDASDVVQIPAATLTTPTIQGGTQASPTITTPVIVNPTMTEINGQFINPAMLKTVSYNETLNASIGTTPFFIADQAYTVTAISYVNKTAGTVAGATATVTKDTGTTAPGAGAALQTAGFTCLAVANTVANGTLTATAADLVLAAGDRLSVKFAGTLTTLAGVVITVTLQPAAASETVQCFWRANGDIKTTSFFQANRDMTVTGVKAVYGTAFAAAVTIDVVKDTGTAAAGGGTSVLAAAMAGDGTINTVLSPALSATASVLSMAAGDRLALKFSATTTGALLCVTVSFAPVYSRKEVTWQLAPTAQEQVAQCFFIADRNYEIVDASEIHDVIASGAANVAVTIDKGTTVPGGGNIVQTDNTSAGFDLTGTARTSQFMTPAALRLRQLSTGDRLGLKVTGAAQSVADVCITCSLRPNY